MEPMKIYFVWKFFITYVNLFGVGDALAFGSGFLVAPSAALDVSGARALGLCAATRLPLCGAFPDSRAKTSPESIRPIGC